MPGCLGLDALWQLLGFFLGWLGAPGRGRALGVGEIEILRPGAPDHEEVVYGIDIKRVMRSNWCWASPTAGSRPTAPSSIGQRPQGWAVPRRGAAANQRLIKQRPWQPRSDS